MKKKILGLVTIAILLLSSCSDFLDEVAYDKFQKKEALSNPTSVYINSVAAIYSAMGLQGTCFVVSYIPLLLFIRIHIGFSNVARSSR